MTTVRTMNHSSMLSYIDNECSFIDGFNLVQESVDPE